MKEGIAPMWIAVRLTPNCKECWKDGCLPPLEAGDFFIGKQFIH